MRIFKDEGVVKDKCYGLHQQSNFVNFYYTYFT